MKRLTTMVHGKSSLVKGMSIFDIEEAIDHLVAIEDILGDEYDLELVQKLIQAYKEGRYIIMKEPEQAGVSRLRELAQADREGRCFVFRFGFGETVYRIWVYPSGKPAFVTENRMDTLNDLLNAETWNNAYKTRAEAEAALRREDTDARENR